MSRRVRSRAACRPLAETRHERARRPASAQAYAQRRTSDATSQGADATSIRVGSLQAEPGLRHEIVADPVNVAENASQLVPLRMPKCVSTPLKLPFVREPPIAKLCVQNKLPTTVPA
jgi:hypothetical protein